MIDFFKNNYNSLNQNHPKQMKLLRYLISGGLATATNLFFLFLFTDIIGIWYLTSSVMSYILSIAVSFTMQKYWTFAEFSSDRIHYQAMAIVVISVTNLSLNTLGIFLLVNYTGLHHLISQLIVSALIAIESFLLYRLIFKVRNQIG